MIAHSHDPSRNQMNYQMFVIVCLRSREMGRVAELKVDLTKSVAISQARAEEGLGIPVHILKFQQLGAGRWLLSICERHQLDFFSMHRQTIASGACAAGCFGIQG
jgi:hypothetical protein